MMQTILVVDDDPSLRAILRTILADAGFAVCEAGDGVTALEQLAAVTPVMVITDIRMPRMGGVAVADQVTRRPKPIPCILMSSANLNPHHQLAPFLAKPFTIEALLDVVARTLLERSARLP